MLYAIAMGQTTKQAGDGLAN